MKKILSTIIVVAMMLSMVSFANVFAAETLITSESFEAGAGSWILPENEVNKAAFSFVDDATDGKKAVKIERRKLNKLGDGQHAKGFCRIRRAHLNMRKGRDAVKDQANTDRIGQNVDQIDVRVKQKE